MLSEMPSRAELRKTIRFKRNSLSAQEQRNASIELCRQLRVLPSIQKANNIALYLANDGELDPMPFIEWCWHNNKQIYLPVIHPFNQQNLLFLHFTKDTILQPNKYNILEPKLNVKKVCPVNEIDVLCTPLVAFDTNGERLGMGGGFYDRTLAKWFTQKNLSSRATLTNTLNKHEKSFHPIGIAHDCQLVNQLPTEQWDIPLPEIITPSKRYLF